MGKLHRGRVGLVVLPGGVGREHAEQVRPVRRRQTVRPALTNGEAVDDGEGLSKALRGPMGLQQDHCGLAGGLDVVGQCRVQRAVELPPRQHVLHLKLGSLLSGFFNTRGLQLAQCVLVQPAASEGQR